VIATATLGVTPLRGPAVTVTPASPAPGDLVVVEVTGGAGSLAATAPLAGTLGERPLRFYPTPKGQAAVAGVDLDTRPGPLAWRVTRPVKDGAPVPVRTGALTVRPREFGVQRLTLPPGQVDLDAATLARVQAEQAEFRAALAAGAAERLWRGAFRHPVEGAQATGGFGLRRVINGQPRSPHAGFDWAAPTGTPVVAAGAGRVLLVAEHFFAGRLVALDHGLGLITLYFHLDATQVAAGDAVATGQPIGAVGATGRVTGPHLHFAVLLDGARVDPEALLALRPPAEPAAAAAVRP
jgi:murein DD-endopeptidase MepM/ murein hydrolase activator NlpD